MDDGGGMHGRGRGRCGFTGTGSNGVDQQRGGLHIVLLNCDRNRPSEIALAGGKPPLMEPRPVFGSVV